MSEILPPCERDVARALWCAQTPHSPHWHETGHAGSLPLRTTTRESVSLSFSLWNEREASRSLSASATSVDSKMLLPSICMRRKRCTQTKSSRHARRETRRNARRYLPARSRRGELCIHECGDLRKTLVERRTALGAAPSPPSPPIAQCFHATVSANGRAGASAIYIRPVSTAKRGNTERTGAGRSPTSFYG